MSKQSNGTYYTTSAIVPPDSPQSPGNEPSEEYGTLELFHPQPTDQSRRTNRQSQVLETIPSDGESGFSFLDPYRKREVQTREEFIS